MRLTQATDGVLSHSVAEWQCLVLMRVFKTRWWRRTPAISKSELVRLPVGLESYTTAAVMSGGDCTCHTVGTMQRVPPNYTPPAPLPLVSQCPM